MEKYFVKYVGTLVYIASLLSSHHLHRDPVGYRHQETEVSTKGLSTKGLSDPVSCLI